MIPGRCAVFEVSVGQKLVYTKEQTGKHPDFHELLRSLMQLLS